MQRRNTKGGLHPLGDRVPPQGLHEELALPTVNEYIFAVISHSVCGDLLQLSWEMNSVYLFIYFFYLIVSTRYKVLHTS